MTELTLDASDDRLSLLLVVAARVLREPLLAIDAATEACALAVHEGADNAGALAYLGRVMAGAARDGRIGAVERRRDCDVARESLTAVQLAEVHALGRAQLASPSELLEQLEHDAPAAAVRQRIAGSGLYAGAFVEVHDGN